ncbi:MAG: hypothetical protein GXP40_09970 [Chloroflexi bacterium]|nr:hypothetical protein [Chloroflexota bacterium]
MPPEKRILFAVLAIFVALLACAESTPAATPDAAPAPVGSGTKGDIQLFTSIIRETDLEPENLEFIATHYDLVLMAYPIREFVDTLRSHNPDIVILLFNNPYFAFGEQFWEASPEEVEPDWVLRTEAGEIIRYNGPAYEGTDWGSPPLMDIRSPEWQAYYAAQSRQYIAAAGMDGLFIDTLTEDIPPWALTPKGEFPAGYTEADWRRGVTTFLDAVKGELGADYSIIFNGVTNAPGTELTIPNQNFLGVTDGASYEAFSVYLNMDADNETRQWYFDHAIMTAMQALVDADKTFLIQVSGSGGHRETRLYALASFLLLQTDKTYFYYAPNEAAVHWYPEWEIEIGEPSGAYYRAEGVYQRDFTQAKVLVNPGKQPVTVQLNGAYKTLDGEALTEVTLNGYTGTILLRTK